jgi:hypothetical protein
MEVSEINWNVELELNLNEDRDLNVSEEGWWVSFTWNGYELKALINFAVNFYTYSDEEIKYTNTDVLDVSISLEELYLNDEEFTVSVKQLIEISNQLEIDLKIQY